MLPTYLLRFGAACTLAGLCACGAGIGVVGTAATLATSDPSQQATAAAITPRSTMDAVTGSIEPSVCLHCAP